MANFEAITVQQLHLYDEAVTRRACEPGESNGLVETDEITNIRMMEQMGMLRPGATIEEQLEEYISMRTILNPDQEGEL